MNSDVPHSQYHNRTSIAEDGRIINNSFADYRLLRACDTPEIVPIIVESNEPTGPYGAKGIGEGCMVNVTSAISNAISHATGVRLTNFRAPDLNWKNFSGGPDI